MNGGGSTTKETAVYVVLIAAGVSAPVGALSALATRQAGRSAPSPNDAVVYAESYRIVNKDGLIVGEFGLDRIGQLGLRLCDQSTVFRAELELGRGGAPVLKFRDEKGCELLALYEREGEPFVQLWGKERETRAILAVHRDNPGLDVYDDKGTLRASFACDNDHPRFILFTQGEEPRLTLSLFEEMPRVDVVGGPGRPSAVLGVESDAGAGVTAFDLQKNARSSIGVDGQGQPVVEVLDSKEETVWTAP